MFFSILTPCYNSADTLMRTYESLLKLDYQNFEWILIDDFSSDNGKTRKMIENISEIAPFKVVYKFLEKNHFGSRSPYEATLLASGKYACILDHDDMLTKDALSIVKDYLEKYNNIVGVCGRCINEHGKFIGTPFKSDYIISNEGEVRFKLNIKGEMFQFTQVEILRKYFFDMKPGYTNGNIWARISLEYNYIYINNILRIYDTGLETSYSNTKSLTIRYPANKAEAIGVTLECYQKYLIYNPLLSIKMFGSLIRHKINAKIPLFKSLPKTKISKIFYILGIIPGIIKAKRF